jgi:CubicO group peptidase (beta-lactamase class C family)
MILQRIVSITCILLLSLPVTGVGQSRAKKSFNIGSKRISTTTFDNQVRRIIKDIGIPGVSLALIDRGEVVYEKAYGIKKLSAVEKVNDSTVFEACSLSKSFLLYLAYKLCDEGKLDLDKPVYEYLEPGVVLEHDPRYKSITTRMILSHSSGLEDWSYENNPDLMELVSAPGKEFNYSSLGYNYLAGVISKILDKPYDAYLKSNVLLPLQLNDTYTCFVKTANDSGKPELPDNYASGHHIFGNEIPKWKIFEGIPSSGISTTAGDYARLILSITDGKHLRPASVAQIAMPVVRTSLDSSAYYYGTGFEILITKNDTIIGHGGSNFGFKGQLFYSIRQKRGFVFLANSDLGKLMTSRLNELTTRLDIADYYRQFSASQYPDVAVTLLNSYKRNGEATMFAAIYGYEKRGLLKENTLPQLGKFLMEHDTVIARKLFDRNIHLFPNVAYTHLLKGDLLKDIGQYQDAVVSYTKAIALGFNLWKIDGDIKYCNNQLQEELNRSRQKIPLSDSTLIQAEDFATMKGVRVEGTADTGGGANICYADPGDWMEYKLLVSKKGVYRVTARLANDMPGSSFEIVPGSGSKVNVAINPTSGWQLWKEQTVELYLPDGEQTLRVNFLSGACNINWFLVKRAEP